MSAADVQLVSRDAARPILSLCYASSKVRPFNALSRN
jgi:hypothetical protein